MLAFAAAFTLLAGFAVASPVQNIAERADAASSPTTTAVITQSLLTTLATPTSSDAGSAVTSGLPPRVNNMQIKQGGRCAMVFGPLVHGMPVVMEDCANSGSAMWTIFGEGNIQATGTDLCLDAGSDPKNGDWARLWECKKEDQWGFGAVQGQIKHTKNNQCLNVDTGNGVKVQTWQCSSGDNNELWLVEESTEKPKSVVSIPVRTSITLTTSDAKPTSTSSTVVTTTKV